MSFNSLPPELTAWIISNVEELEKTELPFSGVPKINISRCASTSTNIRHAVEQRTFSSLRITSDDLPMFEKLMTRSPSRRALPRTRMTMHQQTVAAGGRDTGKPSTQAKPTSSTSARGQRKLSSESGWRLLGLSPPCPYYVR